MSVYLLFDGEKRLVQTRETGNNYGAFDPINIFLQPEDPRRDEFYGVELHPAVVRKVRPPVYHALISHARISAAGLEVDDAESIEASLQRQMIQSAEWALVGAAKEIAAMETAEFVLDGLPEGPAEHLRHMRRALTKARRELYEAREGIIRAPMPEVLQDLAGKVLPI